MTITYTSPSLDERKGWWRDAVTYQIFMPSFFDGNGDGIGDLPGIIARLPYIAALGVDAIWLTPFYPSPQADTGYDITDYCDVDPCYGSLEDFCHLIEQAHTLGLKIIIDIVANHTSTEHPWFKAALASAPGSPARSRYFFRDGQGTQGEYPPNNWPSVFGGSGWQRLEGERQWYMHLFSPEQADLNWRNAEVRAAFRDILRFWLDLGVDGLRIDAPITMIKAEGLPNLTQPLSEIMATHNAPMLHQPELHDIFREWRAVLDEYDDRCMIGEVFAKPFDRGLLYIRPDEMHQRFNFDFLEAPWDNVKLKSVIDQAIAGMQAADAELVWVTSSHDQVRNASRLGLTTPGSTPPGIDSHTEQPNRKLGLQRARAMALLTMILPGAACIYSGEELGLPNHTTMAPIFRRDPRHFRSGGAEVGRDGCRSPMPWNANAPAFGFSDSRICWLPQPDIYKEYAVDAQLAKRSSTLRLYRQLLALRDRFALGKGHFEWLDSPRSDVLHARNGEVELIINFGYVPVALPRKGKILAHSASCLRDKRTLPGNTAVWLQCKSA